MHGLDPPRRRAWQRRRTRRLEDVERLRGGGLELVEHGALGVVRLDRLRDPLDRPVRQPGGLAAAEVGADAAAAGGAPTAVASGGAPTTIALGRSDRGVGAAVARRVGAEHAVVEIVVGVGPEGVIRIGVERVVDEVVVGVRPEQRADPTEDDRVSKAAPPLRVEEAALERRARQYARVGIARSGEVGKSLVAEHAAREGVGGGGRLRVPVRLSLRAHILLRGPIAPHVSGLRRCRRARRRSPDRRCRARRRGWARRVVARTRLGRLGESSSTPAGSLRLLLRGSRRGSRRRRVSCHGRRRRSAGRTGNLLRRGALRRHVRRHSVRGSPLRGDVRRRARSGRGVRRRCRARSGGHVRCRRRVRRGRRASCRGGRRRARRRRSSRFSSLFLRLRGGGCRHRKRNDKNCRDACVPLEHDTTSYVAL